MTVWHLMWDRVRLWLHCLRYLHQEGTLWWTEVAEDCGGVKARTTYHKASGCVECKRTFYHHARIHHRGMP